MAENSIAVNHAAVPRTTGNRATEDQRVEAVRLRTSERLGLKEIAAKIGLSKSTVSLIVRHIPLYPSEVTTKAHRGAEAGRRALSAIAAAKRRPASAYYEVFLQRAKSTDQKGAVAEAAVIFRLKLWGFVPHIPLCSGGKSDIVVFVPDTGRLLKIQVKCVKQVKCGRPLCSLKSRHAGKMDVRYRPEDFDFFVGYDPREDVCYVYSVAELASSVSQKSMQRTAAERWDKLLPPILA